MPSTVTKRIAAAALFALCTATSATDSNTPPRFLTVPVLGLRLPLDRMNLEPFPEDQRAKCGQINDNEVHTARVWVFGQATDASSTYYILTGYFKRRHPEGGQRLYEAWDRGSVFTVRDGKCGGDDAAETFETHDPNANTDGNVPDPVLRELARDLALRTVRAFGGADRLRIEIKSQRIAFNSLPPELQEAFAPYFDR